MDLFYVLLVCIGVLILYMDVVFVEMMKYVVNVMFVMCIFFMNEIVNLCDAFGVDVV